MVENQERDLRTLTAEEIRELKRVPDWLRNKIAKHYVHSEIAKSPDGKTVEWTIKVGDHVAVRLEGKRHPETEAEWLRMNDILEIDHYINWMKRFCEQMSRIEDKEVEDAMKKTEVPSDAEMERMKTLTMWERVCRLPEDLLFRKTWWTTAFWLGVGLVIGCLIQFYLIPRI